MQRRGAGGRAFVGAVPGVRLSRAAITAEFSRKTLDRGAQYWRAGHVGFLRREDVPGGESVIVARVLGSRRTPYEVFATVRVGARGAISVDGDCSCPVGYNCKHVAATLLAAMDAPSNQLEIEPFLLPAGRLPAVAPAPLSSELSYWLDEIARLKESEREEYPPEIRQRLLYLLDVQRATRSEPRLTVSTVSARILKDGGFSPNVQSYNPANALQASPAKFLRPSDRTILRRLEDRSRSPLFGGSYTVRTLRGEDGPAILEAIIATGRAHWRDPAGPVLERGAPRQARFRWRLGDDAAQHVDVDIEGGGQFEVFCLAPPWYVDEAGALIGPLDTGLAPRIAEALLSAPPVPAGQEALLRAAFETRLPELEGLKPPELPHPEQVVGPPLPCLTLAARERAPRLARPPARGDTVPVGRLSFRYGPAEVTQRDRRATLAIAHEGLVFHVTRDQRAERAAEAHLRGLGFGPLLEADLYRRPEQSGDLTLAEAGDEAWFDFLTDSVPGLREAGWEVKFEPDFPFHLVYAQGPVEAQLHEGSGIDWFELDLGVVVDGERVDFTPSLLALISTSTRDPAWLTSPPDAAATSYVPLPDGRTLAIPALRLWKIAVVLFELYGAEPAAEGATTVRLGRFNAVDLALAEAAADSDDLVWAGGQRLRHLGAMLRGGMPRAEIPGSFTATLRPYQASGVDWLQLLRAAELGGVLADDMGLGKTVQTLAHVSVEKASGRLDRPALIVAPTSVAHLWQEEAARFAPELKVLLLHGPDRKQRFGEIGTHDMVVTTFPLLARDRAVLVDQQWHLVVLDEAQTIKNPDAIVSRLARELQTRHRLCLTGTPIENNLGELWSLFSFVSPGLLGERQQFNRSWRRPIERDGDAERSQRLARRLRPFLLRRTKDEVAPELPARTEVVETVEMESAQRDLYESVRLAMHARVRDAIAAHGLARSRIVVLDALLKLRQACCDPRLLKLQTARAARARSAKFDRLFEMLPELLDDGRRVLLFSQFTSMLALIETALQESGRPYVRLTGDTRDRQTPIRAFQSGDVPLFLISLKAGGVGLNLTAADTVIHYDPWWNPAVEDQATNRAHRIGQDKPVLVYRLVTGASIEEKMEALKARKRDLAASIFDAEAGSPLDLTERDIEELFAPA